MKPRVAVIDVGSNSIKALVAERGPGPLDLEVVLGKTMEVRIGTGIGGRESRLLPENIRAGIEAVWQLCEDCRRAGPLAMERIVATSAVRSAANGHLFTEGVAAVTGLTPTVLSGDEEAEAIAMGVLTDPGIGNTPDHFTVFDLGGGSLEVIRFVDRRVTGRTSLPLGAVRLTERFVTNPSMPVPEPEIRIVADFVREQIGVSGIKVAAPLIGCSGGLTAMRDILAYRTGQVFTGEGVQFDRAFVQELHQEVCNQPISARRTIPGMPFQRADIFPAALTVFLVMMELAEADGILHSLHNLRYGLALRMLNPEPPA